jgi:hypothetical protein
MKTSTADVERRVRLVRDSVESGLDKVDEYGRPFVQRHGRKALAVGVVVLVAAAAVMVARRRRPRPLTARLQEALPDSVSDRLERPLSSIRAAASRLGR